MKIYLAARYSRRKQLLDYAAMLHQSGHEVTSRWLSGKHELLDRENLSTQAEQDDRARFAQEDWADLMAADMCVSLTEEPRVTSSRRGRHDEFGAALAAGKRCIIVGHRLSVFHCLPEVQFYPDFDAFMRGEVYS